MAQRRRSRKNQESNTEETIVNLVETKNNAADFFEQNQKNIFTALAVVLVLVAGYFAYKFFYQQPRETTALAQMYKAEQAFAQDSMTKALTDPGGGYPGFIKMVEEYGSTNAGDVANLYAAESYMKEGKFEAALDYLKDYSGGGNIAAAIRNGMKGDAYSELGKMSDAISSYKKAAKTENEFFAPYYLFKLGLLNQKEGKNDAALDAYNRIASEFPNSLQGQNIDAYIERVSK